MARFCESCGTPYEEGTTFCTNCGKNVNAAPQAAPKKVADNSPIGMVKQYLLIIVAVVAVFALIAGIMNLFATYDVTATMEYGGYEASESGPLSDLRDGEEFGLYLVSNYVMGIVALAVAGLLGYTAYLLYSKAAGSKKFFSLAALIGTVGTAVALIMAFIGCKEEQFGASMTLSINFTYWVMLILCGALLALDKTILKSDYAPLK